MTARHLTLATGLTLPLDIVTQKLAWLGVTGSGKTYGASKLFELLFHAGAQLVALDPVGVWWGTRLDKGGKKPSTITVPVFGGLHGDVPLEPTGGALLANLIVDKALSAIVDVSQFESDAAKARFASDFADRLFQRRKAAPAAMHLFLEECQEFVPQNPQRGEEHMLHVFTRMQKLGRNYGIGSSYISQRPQEVNKKALNMAQTLFVFRTTGVHERKAIEAWVHDKALDQDIAGDLPKIATGHCHVWSPEFLEVSHQVHILPKETFNASATPEVGAAAVTRELAPIDLAQIAKDMAATIEKAKSEDPKLLRAEVAALRRQLATEEARGNHNAKVAMAPAKRVEVLTDADRALLEKVSAAIVERSRLAREILAAAESRVDKRTQEAVAEYLNTVRNVGIEVAGTLEQTLERVGVKRILDKLSVLSPQPSALSPQATTYLKGHGTSHAVTGKIGAPSVTEHVATPRRAPLPPVASGDIGDDRRLVDAKGHLKKHVRLFLTALAHHPAGLTREQLHLHTGYVPSGDTSSGLNAAIDHGLVLANGDRFTLSTAGGFVLGPVDPLPTGAALRDRALASASSSAERKILTALFDTYPSVAARAEVHERAGLKPSGDTSTAINKGLKLGWIVERDGGFVAADHFFEER